MFDKRLLALVPGAKRLIAGNVFLQWLALAANIVMMVCLGLFMQGVLVDGGGSLAQAGMLFGLVWLDAPTLLVVVTCAVVVRAAATIGAQRLSLATSTEAKRIIRLKLYDKLMALGPNYTEQVSTSAATQVSVEGVEQLEVYYGAYLPQFFYALLAPVTLFVCLAPLSLPASVVLLVCVPLIPGSIMMFQKLAKRLMKYYWGSYTDLGALFLENIQGLTTLKIYQADAARHEHMNDQAENFRQATMRVLRMQLNSVTIMDVLAYGGAAIGIVIVLWEFLTGQIGFAAAFAITFLSADFFLPMRALGSLFHTAMNGMAAADRMFELLDTPEPQGRTASIDGREPSIRLSGMGYAYVEGQPVLQGVDLDVRPGEFVAVVGESGSGKSTLAGILCGKNARYTGSAQVAGVELSTIDRASLGRALTYVGFDSRLFQGTVRDNLLVALPADELAALDETSAAQVDERLWRALERAQVADFVRANGGLDLVVAENASNLSGGQRQRIVLARALLHDTPLYIFDEATSSIDPASEVAVLDAIHHLADQGKTIVMISHRLSSVRKADIIYALANGTVAESGTHDELMATGGVYARMVISQRELEAFAAPETFDETSVPASNANTAPATSVPAGNSNTVPATSVPASNANTVPATSNPGAAAAPATPTDAKSRSGLRIMARMVGLVKPLAGFMTLAVVLGILGFLCAIMVTVLGATTLAQWMADPGATGQVAFAAIAAPVIVIAVMRGPLHYGEQICNHYIAFRLLALIRDRVFAALRRLAPAKLEGRNQGNLVSLVTADIELLEVFYAHTISPIIIAVVTCVVMVALTAAQSVQLAMLMLAAYVCVGIVVPLCAAKASAGLGAASRKSVGAMNSFVLESLRCLGEVVQFGQVDARRAQLVDHMGKLERANAKLKMRAAQSSAVTYALVLLFDVICALLGAQLVAQGEIPATAAVIGLALLMSSYGPVIATANLGTTLQATLASGARVLDLLDEQPQVAENVAGLELDPAQFTGARAQNVTFSYSRGAEPTIANVTADVNPGTVVRIAGRSGSGKSTLCKLLMRFWDVDEGEILVSGAGIRQIRTSSLRSVQAYMTQDTHLFCGTLFDNIALARAGATEQEVLEACDKASLGDLIAHLPDGLQTQVAELGSSLSGGERQRIGLARVFLSGAPFVLLDEPTSNLDALNEAAVLRAIQSEREGKTIVLVSHRASTAALADCTITVEAGRVS